MLSVEPQVPVGKTGVASHRLYGRNLVSDFVFANRLAPGSETPCAGEPRVTFECVTSLSYAPDLTGSIAYSSPPSADGTSSGVVHRLEDCLVVRFRTADFYLRPDRIVCHLPDTRYRYLVEIQLLGVVLACWLEWRGVPALHASAVSVGGRAAAFLSTAGGGKSSIAMSFMREGHPLLTDDILPVEISGGMYVGHPGYPQVRMWPDQARRFLGGHEDLDLVHPAFSKRRVVVGDEGFGSFCDASVPLACLYLPERRARAGSEKNRVEITPVSRREGLMHLIGNSFVAPIVEALGLQPYRMRVLAALLSQTPVRRVVYPDGFDNLPLLQRAVQEDLDNLKTRAETS